MDYKYLYQYIPVGIENAIHQKDLAAVLHTTPAAVKSVVRRARQQGLEICSGADGYWFAADESEKRAFVRMMRKQAFSRLASSSPLYNSLKQVRGQISLTDTLNAAGEDTYEQERKEEVP